MKIEKKKVLEAIGIILLFSGCHLATQLWPWVTPYIAILLVCAVGPAIIAIFGYVLIVYALREWGKIFHND